MRFQKVGTYCAWLLTSQFLFANIVILGEIMGVSQLTRRDRRTVPIDPAVGSIGTGRGVNWDVT
jgi:hypothetical protein